MKLPPRAEREVEVGGGVDVVAKVADAVAKVDDAVAKAGDAVATEVDVVKSSPEPTNSRLPTPSTRNCSLL